MSRRAGVDRRLAASLAVNAGLALLVTRAARRRVRLQRDKLTTGRRRTDAELAEMTRDFDAGWSSPDVALVGDSQLEHAPVLDLLDLPVRNRAVGGASLADVPEWIDGVLAQRPGRIVLMIGSNDAKFAVPPARYAAAAHRLFDRLRGLDVVVVGVPPLPGCDGPVAAVNAVLARHAAAGGHAFVDLVAALDGLDWTDDGLHLNAAAYRVLRDLVRPLVT